MKVTVEIPDIIVKKANALLAIQASDDEGLRMILQSIAYCNEHPQEISVDTFGDEATNLGLALCMATVSDRIEQMEKEEKQKAYDTD